MLPATFPSDRTPVVACPVPPRPCCSTWTSSPLAHEAVMSGSSRHSCLVCSLRRVHPPASVRVCVGKPSPSCLVVHPLVVDPPAVHFCICPSAAPCTCSCFARVRPRAQGRCARCPPGSGVMPVSIFQPSTFNASFSQRDMQEGQGHVQDQASVRHLGRGAVMIWLLQSCQIAAKDSVADILGLQSKKLSLKLGLHLSKT